MRIHFAGAALLAVILAMPGVAAEVTVRPVAPLSNSPPGTLFDAAPRSLFPPPPTVKKPRVRPATDFSDAYRPPDLKEKAEPNPLQTGVDENGVHLPNSPKLPDR